MRNFTNKDFTEDSLNQLENSTEIGDNVLVPSSVGSDNKSWAKKTFSMIYDYIKKNLAITSNSPTLSYGSTSTIGSVGGKALKVTMPANPNTDEKVKQTHTSANSNRSILLATNSGTGTVTGGTYKNSGVMVNTSTKKITSSGFVVNGSSSDYMLLGDGTTQAEHNTRNHQSLFVTGLTVSEDFINNSWKYFIDGEDTIDTFIIAPFNGGGSFDFSVLTEYIMAMDKNVSKKRFHIYLEYIGDRIALSGCLSNADWLSANCGGKLECYFDEKMGVWFVEYNPAMQYRAGKHFDNTTYKDYCAKYMYKR